MPCTWCSTDHRSVPDRIDKRRTSRSGTDDSVARLSSSCAGEHLFTALGDDHDQVRCLAGRLHRPLTSPPASSSCRRSAPVSQVLRANRTSVSKEHTPTTNRSALRRSATDQPQPEVDRSRRHTCLPPTETVTTRDCELVGRPATPSCARSPTTSSTKPSAPQSERPFTSAHPTPTRSPPTGASWSTSSPPSSRNFARTSSARSPLRHCAELVPTAPCPSPGGVAIDARQPTSGREQPRRFRAMDHAAVRRQCRHDHGRSRLPSDAAFLLLLLGLLLQHVVIPRLGVDLWRPTTSQQRAPQRPVAAFAPSSNPTTEGP